MNKKALFFDVDGTLFKTKLGVPESTKRAIEKLKKNGHLVFVSTGRSKGNIDKKIEELNFDGYVCGAGSYVEVGDKVLYNVTIPPKELIKIKPIMDEAKSVIIYEGPEKIYYDENDKAYISALINRFRDVWPIHNFTLVDLENAVVNKLCCDIYPDTNVKLIEDKLGKDYSLIIHGDQYVEIMPKGLNKAVGIEKVLEYVGIDKKDTIAFGDSKNDIEMIEMAGCGVAMGNSFEELIKVADMVTDTIENDGIEKALIKLELIS